MASFPDKLTPLQRELLDAFFARETGFYLTGGAALAGFYLGHRTTLDLDLFTPDPEAFERGRFALAAAAESLTASLEARQAAPGFHRYLARRGEEAVVVDLVLERVPQVAPLKRREGQIRIDPPEEILANKLAALVERSEVRDVVDLLLLERSGWAVESALPGTQAKDAACTPATLAWVLSRVQIPAAAEIPGGFDPADLRSYLDELIQRLRRAALPTPR